MAQTIGIIGGADGPTAIFVTGDPISTIVSTALAVFIALLILNQISICRSTQIIEIIYIFKYFSICGIPNT